MDLVQLWLHVLHVTLLLMINLPPSGKAITYDRLWHLEDLTNRNIITSMYHHRYHNFGQLFTLPCFIFIPECQILFWWSTVLIRVSYDHFKDLLRVGSWNLATNNNHLRHYLKFQFSIRSGLHVTFWWRIPKATEIWVPQKSSFGCPTYKKSACNFGRTSIHI